MLKHTLLVGAAAIGLGLGPVHAQDRYQGETIRIIINLGAGGSTGVLAQLFANHWKRLIPGNPEIIVQPVTGGAQMAGIVAAQNARPDGLTVGWVAWSGPTRAIGPASQNVDASRFEVIAGMGVPSMAYMRADVGTGVTGPQDLPGLQGIRIGGYNPISYLDLSGRLALDILGVSHDYTTGFGDGSSIVAALQRNEVNFHVTPAGNYFGGIEDNIVNAGIGVPLWYYELLDADGNDPFAETFAGIPSFSQVVADLTGAPPSGVLYDALDWLNRGMAGTTWFIGVPAGVDPELVSLLRSTFEQTYNDPDFRAEVVAITGIVPSYTPHSAMQDLVAELQTVDPAIAETVLRYIETGTR